MKEDKIEALIQKMTLEEKAGLCSGSDFWHTKGIKRLGIPSIMMSDGPHGMRKVIENGDDTGSETVEAVCFPPAVLLASSWDKRLLELVGETLGEECLTEQVSILLGPAINIKRSPLCGRNFEYLSEDPYLSGQLATSYINGVQSKGIGTSLKHFAANNQEHNRMSVDEQIDERTLREIYLANFEIPVTEAKPWTVMCAYNKINGELCSEKERLLTTILRDEWGFEDVVVSDWGAVNHRVNGLKAGLELEMPSSYGIGESKIIKAVQDGELEESVLDRSVRRLLRVVFRAFENLKEDYQYDKGKHHEIAKKAAEESMVLLKNEDGILPLKKRGSIAIIGEFASKPRYQGGGSSHVNPFIVDSPFDEIKNLAGENTDILYSRGYDADKDETDKTMLEQAKKTAGISDVAVVFAGLPERYESEGYDREHMRMPENQNRLIEELAKEQQNLIVVLSNGSPIEMPWAEDVMGIVEGYLGGQAFGSAIAGLLFGDVNPSGKLAETFPVSLENNPSHLNFPGEGYEVAYQEGVFVGYRYYDKKKIEPLFPFGYGLSYTQFEYSGISMDNDRITDRETVSVSVSIKNTGELTGKEIVQLYVGDRNKAISRPEKELKGFEKIEINPGEEKTVTFTLDKRSFAYYNTQMADWHVQTGEYDILVGASSKDIRQKKTIEVSATTEPEKEYHRNTTIGDLMNDPDAAPMMQELSKSLVNQMGLEDISSENPEIALSIMRYMPLRGLINFSRGKFTEEMLDDLLKKLNQKQ